MYHWLWYELPSTYVVKEKDIQNLIEVLLLKVNFCNGCNKGETKCKFFDICIDLFVVLQKYVVKSIPEFSNISLNNKFSKCNSTLDISWFSKTNVIVMRKLNITVILRVCRPIMSTSWKHSIKYCVVPINKI